MMTNVTMDNMWERLRKLHEYNTSHTKDKGTYYWIKVEASQENPMEFQGHIICSGFYGKLYHRERNFQTLLDKMEAELSNNEKYAMGSGFDPHQK